MGLPIYSSSSSSSSSSTTTTTAAYFRNSSTTSAESNHSENHSLTPTSPNQSGRPSTATLTSPPDADTRADPAQLLRWLEQDRRREDPWSVWRIPAR